LLKEFVRHLSETVPPLLGALRDDASTVRREAALALGEARQVDRVLPALFQLAKDQVAEVRAASFEALGKLGCNSRKVLEVVRPGLRDLIPIVRLEAAKAVWVLTGDTDVVVPVLSGVLPTQEGWQAAYALGNIGPAAAPAVPALIEVLKREKVPRAFRTPPSSSLALGKIQEPAIPALEAVLNDPEPAVRLAAVVAFNFMGPHAHSAVPQLLKLLHDSEPEVRQVTAITLAAAGAEKSAVLPSLEECLGAEDIYMRSTAVALLRQLAPEREWAVAAE
jgi:HEAT repeat protein